MFEVIKDKVFIGTNLRISTMTIDLWDEAFEKDIEAEHFALKEDIVRAMFDPNPDVAETVRQQIAAKYGHMLLKVKSNGNLILADYIAKDNHEYTGSFGKVPQKYKGRIGRALIF